MKYCPNCRTPSFDGLCRNEDCFEAAVCGCRRFLYLGAGLMVFALAVGVGLLMWSC